MGNSLGLLSHGAGLDSLPSLTGNRQVEKECKDVKQMTFLLTGTEIMFLLTGTEEVLIVARNLIRSQRRHVTSGSLWLPPSLPNSHSGEEFCPPQNFPVSFYRGQALPKGNAHG